MCFVYQCLMYQTTSTTVDVCSSQFNRFKCANCNTILIHHFSVFKAEVTEKVPWAKRDTNITFSSTQCLRFVVMMFYKRQRGLELILFLCPDLISSNPCKIFLSTITELTSNTKESSSKIQLLLSLYIQYFMKSRKVLNKKNMFMSRSRLSDSRGYYTPLFVMGCKFKVWVQMYREM